MHACNAMASQVDKGVCCFRIRSPYICLVYIVVACAWYAFQARRLGYSGSAGRFSGWATP